MVVLVPLAHPRSRGENPQENLGTTTHAWLIPAHAGKTKTSGEMSATPAAHPRSRGENVKCQGLPTVRVGSSPLTRGKRPVSGSGSSSRGLIPAHAGKTTVSGDRAHERRAHPRSRGENRDGVLKSMSIGGSSPLTRGKPPEDGSLTGALRLIPAHAGKTSWGPTWGRCCTAHPRSRGENLNEKAQGTPTNGSSPLTRGKPERGLHGAERGRLIPAHAGKTLSLAGKRTGMTAHPRSRGENAS